MTSHGERRSEGGNTVLVESRCASWYSDTIVEECHAGARKKEKRQFRCGQCNRLAGYSARRREDQVYGNHWLLRLHWRLKARQ